MFPPRMPQDTTDAADASIRQTDNDAAGARLSAAQKGYFVDPFIQHFVPRARLQPSRPPLINVGTYVRGEGIDRLVEGWIDLSAQLGEGKVQVVSLGAGSDTRFWRLAAGTRAPAIAAYVEIDLPENTMKKAMAIRKSHEMSAMLGSPDKIQTVNGGTGLQSPKYHIIAADLRQNPTQALSTLLSPDSVTTTGLISRSIPTLLLFECVLCYMQPTESQRLIQWFADAFKDSAPLGAVIYEMFGLVDSFGRVMRENLKARNVTLPGVEPYVSFDSLPTRLLQCGFGTAKAVTLRQVRKDYTDLAELERISRLEMLDELEELDLVLGHYAITWGVLVPEKDNGRGWENWNLQKAKKPEDEDE